MGEKVKKGRVGEVKLLATAFVLLVSNPEVVVSEMDNVLVNLFVMVNNRVISTETKAG